MEPSEHTEDQRAVSRSGVLLGAAGLAGAAALAALPGTARGQAVMGGAGGLSGVLHAEPDVAVKRRHPHYDRSTFDRANATVTLKGDAGTMRCRVVDVQPLRHAEGARRGSRDWGGGFSILLQRTKGPKLGHGTFTATANGKRFPLTISEVAPDVYQVIINRFTPTGS
ncbi:MAG: hypothetical protein ACO3KD_08545 [Gaiellales bacterium]